MKDPQRLLEGDGSASELSLLRAGLSEEPAPEAVRRTAAALGVSLAVLSAPAVGSASQLAGASGAPAASVPSAAAAGSGVLKLLSGKLALAALALAGGVLAVTSGLLLSSAPGAEPASAVRQRAAAPSAPAHAEQPPRAARALPKERSIAREIAALDAVREALGRNDARVALSALDGYAAAHPDGALRPEARLLRVEALWRVGERSRARELAAAFLREQPASPHAQRLRSLLAMPAHAP